MIGNRREIQRPAQANAVACRMLDLPAPGETVGVIGHCPHAVGVGVGGVPGVDMQVAPVDVALRVELAGGLRGRRGRRRRIERREQAWVFDR